MFRKRVIDEQAEDFISAMRDADHDELAIARLEKNYEAEGKLDPSQVRNKPRPPKPSTPIAKPEPTPAGVR